MMSGYRERSNYDPYAGGDYGPPLRPYNWVQWTGVAIALVGIAIDLVYLGGSSGITPRLLDSPSIGVSLPLVGAALINSRRAPGQPPSPEAKRRTMIILAATLAICAAAAALVIYFKGAH
jgi:hypothetical protein